MLKRIKALFDPSDQSVNEIKGFEDKQVAAAALLVEAAATDENFDETEQATVLEILRSRFNLSGEDAAELLAEGQKAQDQAVQLYGFTRNFKEASDHDERIQIIEMLWEVAYADGALHDYESNLIRRVAGLLHVTDRDRGDARKRVLARLSL